MSDARSKSWNWKAVQPGSSWEEPSQEIHYLAHRWTCRPGLHVRHALFLAERGFTVDAMDLSVEGLDALSHEAAARGLSVRMTRGDMLSLPFDDGIFDCLIAYHVIYHSDRRGVESVIADIRRVLKPGAELFVPVARVSLLRTCREATGRTTKGGLVIWVNRLES